MKTFIAVLALAAAFIPSSLLAQTSHHRFTQSGTTYVYAVTPAKNGRQVIEGHRLPTGSAFRLVMTGNRVDGMSGGQPVSFRTAGKAATEVAAR
jgi:hypothetical protein